MGRGLQRSVGGAQALLLHHHRVRRRGRRHRRHAGTDHHDDVLEGGGATVDQVGQHRPAGDRVQRLRQRRLHSGGLAGGKENRGGGHHGAKGAVCAAACQRMDGRSARRRVQS